MASQTLQCPCGHRWDRPDAEPVPADLREICPACTAAGRAARTPAKDGPAARDGQLKPGDRLADFEVIRPLNRGGMGVVYQARQVGLDRLAALKVIAPDVLGKDDSAEYLERFRREVRAAALLNHPNIVTVYATDLSGPRPYLAMEYVDGIDLYRLVERAGPLGFADSCEYVRQAALGLQHAFERGLVHRDIKPHNLMVTPSPLAPAPASGPRPAPVVKILDLGLARVDAPDPGLAQGLTQAEAFLGTPDFAAPEQAEDARTADIRADLYSLGATWFYLLTGQLPFPGATLMQKLKRQLAEPTPLVTEHRPDVPPPIAAFVRTLMDKDPDRRFQTPAELAEAIADYQRDPDRATAWVSAAAGLEHATVPAHAGGVGAVCLNGDGRRLLSGGDDQVLRVWELPALTETRQVAGDPGPVCAAAITRSGKWGVSCALRLMPEDMVAQLWDLNAGIERGRLTGANENLTCLALSPDARKVAAGDRAGAVHVWTLDPPDTPALTLRGHVGAINGLTFTPDGTAVLSVGHDGMLRRWDVETGRLEGELPGDAGAVWAIACGARGRVALAGDRLRLNQPGGSLRTLEGHAGPALCVAFSANGTVLASGGADGSVRLWRASDGGEVACFTGHDGPVRAVAVSPDHRFVYSGGADGTLRRWAVGPAALPRARSGSSLTRAPRPAPPPAPGGALPQTP
jgi:eukaryotic-like serine/threonine-protein kinase